MDHESLGTTDLATNERLVWPGTCDFLHGDNGAKVFGRVFLFPFVLRLKGIVATLWLAMVHVDTHDNAMGCCLLMFGHLRGKLWMERCQDLLRGRCIYWN